MKKALVIAPVFFDYEKVICAELENRGFQVDFVDQDGMKKEYWECWNMSFFSKVKRHLIPGQRERDRIKAAGIFTEKYLDRWTGQIDTGENAYSLILTVKGDFVPDRFYEILREKNKSAEMILYLWDDIGILNKTCFFKYFDRIISYNVEDCEKMGWKYLPIFVQKTKANPVPYSERKYDIAMIGTGHIERIRMMRRIYRKYKDRYSFYIYFVKRPDVDIDFFTYEKKLCFDEYMEILSESRAVVDIPLGVQDGPTTRVFDALLTKTKVLTTNSNVKKYPVYGKNISVLDEKNPVIEERFISEEYTDEGKTILSISEWFEAILD